MNIRSKRLWETMNIFQQSLLSIKCPFILKTIYLIKEAATLDVHPILTLPTSDEDDLASSGNSAS